MEKNQHLVATASDTHSAFRMLDGREHLPHIEFICDDITKLDVDGFIYYARPDLQLGSGFGGMIRRRGGADIQKELNAQAPRNVGEAVITSAGKLLARFIVHAVGPKLGESQFESKLESTIVNSLGCCEKMKAHRIAMPPLGTGYHGLSIETCASITMTAIADISTQLNYLSEIVICLRDAWIVPISRKLFFF